MNMTGRGFLVKLESDLAIGSTPTTVLTGTVNTTGASKLCVHATLAGSVSIGANAWIEVTGTPLSPTGTAIAGLALPLLAGAAGSIHTSVSLPSGVSTYTVTLYAERNAIGSMTINALSAAQTAFATLQVTEYR